MCLKIADGQLVFSSWAGVGIYVDMNINLEVQVHTDSEQTHIVASLIVCSEE